MTNAIHCSCVRPWMCFNIILWNNSPSEYISNLSPTMFPSILYYYINLNELFLKFFNRTTQKKNMRDHLYNENWMISNVRYKSETKWKKSRRWSSLIVCSWLQTLELMDLRTWKQQNVLFAFGNNSQNKRWKRSSKMTLLSAPIFTRCSVSEAPIQAHLILLVLSLPQIRA